MTLNYVTPSNARITISDSGDGTNINIQLNSAVNQAGDANAGDVALLKAEVESLKALLKKQTLELEVVKRNALSDDGAALSGKKVTALHHRSGESPVANKRDAAHTSLPVHSPLTSPVRSLSVLGSTAGAPLGRQETADNHDIDRVDHIHMQSVCTLSPDGACVSHLVEGQACTSPGYADASCEADLSLSPSSQPRKLGEGASSGPLVSRGSTPSLRNSIIASHDTPTGVDHDGKSPSLTTNDGAGTHKTIFDNVYVPNHPIVPHVTSDVVTNYCGANNDFIATTINTKEGNTMGVNDPSALAEPTSIPGNGIDAAVTAIPVLSEDIGLHKDSEPVLAPHAPQLHLPKYVDVAVQTCSEMPNKHVKDVRRDKQLQKYETKGTQYDYTATVKPLTPARSPSHKGSHVHQMRAEQKWDAMRKEVIDLRATNEELRREMEAAREEAGRLEGLVKSKEKEQKGPKILFRSGTGTNHRESTGSERTSSTGGQRRELAEQTPLLATQKRKRVDGTTSTAPIKRSRVSVNIPDVVGPSPSYRQGIRH